MHCVELSEHDAWGAGDLLVLHSLSLRQTCTVNDW